MHYVFALAMFMIVVATRRKLASLGHAGVAQTPKSSQAGHAWTALGLGMAVACLLCIASPSLSEMQVPVGANGLPLWSVPFTGVFSWFLLALMSNRW